MGLVAAVGTAVTAIAASVGVAVTATALTVGFTTIAAVGAGLSVIGAVTGDKALSYVGMGLGLVGGIGALASSAGVIGADAASDFAPAASTADTGAVDIAGNATTASGDVVDSFASDLPAESTATTGLADTSGADSFTVDDPLDQPGAVAGGVAGEPAAASGAVSSLGAPPGNDVTLAASTSSPDTAGAATANAPTGEVAPAAPTTAPAPNPSMPPTGVTPVAGGVDTAAPGAAGEDSFVSDQPAAASSGVLGNILGFVQKNPLLAYGAVQAGGSLLSGLTSTLTPAQVTALNAQAASNQAAANLTTQQTQNLAQPRSTAALAPVTGTPNTIITPPTAGIINGAPPVNITGAPT